MFSGRSGGSGAMPAIEAPVRSRLLSIGKGRGVVMDTLHRIAGGCIKVLVLSLLLAVVAHSGVVESGPVRLTNGKNFSAGNVPSGIPQTGRPLYSPPVFMDRSAPISERPFAKPFLDHAPSIADRPLAPLGGGAQIAPGGAPFIWCQGEWVRIDKPSPRCAWR